MARNADGQFIAYNDIWLLDGVRTPFADYNGILGLVSPTDLGIQVARAVLERAKIAPSDVGSVIAGSVAQASFEAYMLPLQSTGQHCWCSACAERAWKRWPRPRMPSP